MTLTPEQRLSSAHERLDAWLAEANDGKRRMDDAVAEVSGWFEELTEAVTEAFKVQRVRSVVPAGREHEVVMVEFPATLWDRIVGGRDGLSNTVRELNDAWEPNE